MQTALEIVEKIQLEAKQSTQEIRFVESAKVDDFVRQGDIVVIFVDESFPKGKVRTDHQLAPGISKGSRHIAGPKMKVYEGVQAPEVWKNEMKKNYPRVNIGMLEKMLLGPRLFVPKRESITHPEHAHVSCPDGAHIQIVYQLNSRTMKRAED